jgi:hypothetical protein
LQGQAGPEEFHERFPLVNVMGFDREIDEEGLGFIGMKLGYRLLVERCSEGAEQGDG